MTVYKAPAGKARDKGTRVIYDSKSIIGINASRLQTRAPQIEDHFLDSNTVRATAWVATETGVGAGKALFVATVAADGGTVVGTSGAAAGNAEELGWALAHFKPSTMATFRPLTFEARLKTSGVTTADAFFGLHKINTSTGTAGRLATVSAASALAGITAADEFAGFGWSSGATSGGLSAAAAAAVGLVTIKAGVGTATAASTAVGASTFADLTVYRVYRVEVDVNGACYFYINDSFVGRVDIAVTTTVALLPYFDVVSTGATNSTMTIDYCFVGGDLA